LSRPPIAGAIDLQKQLKVSSYTEEREKREKIEN
jgi:hypothetical protein